MAKNNITKLINKGYTFIEKYYILNYNQCIKQKSVVNDKSRSVSMKKIFKYSVYFLLFICLFIINSINTFALNISIDNIDVI